MERLATNYLVKWFNNKYRKPLILYGPRQVGKTYLVTKLFADIYFKNKYIYVDLNKEIVIRNYLLNEINPKNIINYLEVYYNVLIDNKTLLIFDEAQECLPIITALKYFKESYRDIPVIVTGSMVRIKLLREQNKQGFFFPIGAIDEYYLYPLNFEEFLINYNKTLYNLIVKAYNDKVNLDTPYHTLAMDALYTYLLIGGMPESLNIYLESKSILLSRQNLVSLYNNYLNDMSLYQTSNDSITRTKDIFNSIYLQLNKENKNFKSSLINDKFKTRDLKSPLLWLEAVGVINISKQTKPIVTLPLKEKNEYNFRLYLTDVGLLSYQSNIEMNHFIDHNLQNDLSGVLFENYVANELVTNGIPLFYWKGKIDHEFEFIVNSNNKIIPIDVKKGKSTLTSLREYSEHNKLEFAIKISNNHYGYDTNTKIYTYPLYEAFLIAKDIKNNKL